MTVLQLDISLYLSLGRKHCEKKEKMMVTSIFSCSDNVLKVFFFKVVYISDFVVSIDSWISNILKILDAVMPLCRYENLI